MKTVFALLFNFINKTECILHKFCRSSLLGTKTWKNTDKLQKHLLFNNCRFVSFLRLEKEDQAWWGLPWRDSVIPVRSLKVYGRLEGTGIGNGGGRERDNTINSILF